MCLLIRVESVSGEDDLWWVTDERQLGHLWPITMDIDDHRG